ncbi:hypothetical protein [Roseobacter sp. EG26]|uniref:hypothetical protein n=1 Tax=Roseobacter sp. EG26 TaxID=3412477 RepID=UPI003CE5A2BA
MSSLLLATPVSATEYSCQTETFCACQEALGCNSIDEYLHKNPTEICRSDSRVFEATVHGRKIILNGEELRITFKEARPYFNDFDWYQAGATDDRGLINLTFDNEGLQTDFEIRQMVRGSVNDHIWKLAGNCKVLG